MRHSELFSKFGARKLPPSLKLRGTSRIKLTRRTIGWGVLPFIILIGGGLLVGWQYFGWFQPKISAVSDVPGISLKLVKPERLSEQLTVWGFWEEDGVLLQGEEKLVTVKRLVVHLTDKEQPDNQFINSEGKVTYATGERYEKNGTYHLFVFFTDFYLGRIPSEEIHWDAFEELALKTLLVAGIDDPTLPEKARADIIQDRLGFINDIMSREERLFKVVKR